jgi:omega-6 fatty acid desaturase (delta-12 desaturase)
MIDNKIDLESPPTMGEINNNVQPYTLPHAGKATWQLVNTLVPYLALWVLMIVTVKMGYSYWITLGLAVVASALLIRIFIFFHDCCHGSFFSSKKANQIIGFITGTMAFTAFRNWRRAHLLHHATSGNLDHRGTGDVWTLTVDEYYSAPFYKRLGYRIFRNPLFLFGIIPSISFYIGQRIPNPNARKADRRNLWYSNLAIIAIIIVASLTIGLKTYLIIQIPIMSIAATLGIWLFYVQHQFEGVYWAREEDWDPVKAALEGSSYYKLPKVLQWFTGNIGLHHVHHLNSQIPNYYLQQCLNEVEIMQSVRPITIRESLKSLRMRLWDEDRQELVSFRQLKQMPGYSPLN